MDGCDSFMAITPNLQWGVPRITTTTARGGGEERYSYTSFSLMGQSCLDLANMLPACLRGSTSILNEQAERSIWLTEKLVILTPNQVPHLLYLEV